MGERSRRLRALWLAAELLAVVAAAWWWTSREKETPRVGPPPRREAAEREGAAPPIGPEATRSADVAAPPPAAAAPPELVAARSPLLLPDRVLVVSGVVVAAEGGAPIEGAEVTVRDDLLGAPVGDAESDEQGRYEARLEGGVAPRLRVEAKADGASFDVVVAAVEPDATTLRADFRLRRSFDVAVEVVSAASGAPIPFAHVVLSDERPGRREMRRDGEADAAGRFSEGDIDDLPRRGLAVVVEAEGFAPRRFASLEVPDHDDRLALRCDLSPTRPLSGIVITSRGERIAGALVELASLHGDFEDDGDETATGDDGRFELEAGGIPEELATLLVRADELQTVRIDRPWSGGASVTVVMAAPDPPWRGRVVDRATGLGVAECRLETRLCSTAPPSQFGRSVEEGVIDASLQGLPHGFPLQVFATADGYATTTIDVVAANDGVLSCPAVIELERLLVIRGRVLDASGGAPPQKAMVLARLDSATIDEEFASLHGRANGPEARYEIELPLSVARAAGRCSFVVVHDRRRHALGRLDLRAALARMPAGEPPVITLDLPIDASPRRLPGR